MVMLLLLLKQTDSRSAGSSSSSTPPPLLLLLWRGACLFAWVGVVGAAGDYLPAKPGVNMEARAAGKNIYTSPPGGWVTTNHPAGKPPSRKTTSLTQPKNDSEGSVHQQDWVPGSAAWFSVLCRTLIHLLLLDGVVVERCPMRYYQLRERAGHFRPYE